VRIKEKGVTMKFAEVKYDLLFGICFIAIAFVLAKILL